MRLPIDWHKKSLPFQAGWHATVRALRSRTLRAIALLIIATHLTLVWQWRNDSVFFVVALYGFSVLALVGSGRLNGLSSDLRARRICAWSARILRLASLLANVGCDACAHSRYISFGPFFFGIDARPCHNPRTLNTLVTKFTGRHQTSADW